MKLVLLFAVACLALHNGKGAPATAVYKFLRCNPEGGNANCKVHQSSEIPWSPDLPSKLPASDAEYVEAQPVESEEAPSMMDGPSEPEEEDEPIRTEDGESPMFFPGEEGSGYEGSATDYFTIADEPKEAEIDTGSGESWTDFVQPLAGKVRNIPVEAAKPTEQDLEEDHLLQI